ncbi:MAG: carbamoyl-phosphate synthase large subunit [bacterium]
MPRRNDIRKVMIIGSGPIVIGQACEFDYSGTQACKALRKLGYEIVLVNSNPATIMTDPGMADRTYIEPLNLETLSRIVRKERPDALLPNLGGQTGLNLSSELARSGVLDECGVKIIGVELDAIERGENRLHFKETMQNLGIGMPRSELAYKLDEAERIVKDLGFPVVIRPAYTLGGTGGGLVYNIEEFRTVVNRGLAASLIGQVLVEESVLGWEELELEVVRDSKNQMITVCFIENVDAMGVHTGDSFCVAPMLTISSELQKKLQEYSYRIVESIRVIGGTNIQFAHDPVTGRVVVIEINPRTSRSSALASKATGFPIAMVSSLLAAGLTLDEIPYWRKGTLEKYEPWGEYVVVKFSRWAFEKMRGAEDKLGTQMKAVGEVMSIGKNYKEAFQKAIRSLEIGRQGLGFAKDFNSKPLDELMNMLSFASSERQFIMYEALRKGAGVDALYRKTHIKPWFIQQMKELVEIEEQILREKNFYTENHGDGTEDHGEKKQWTKNEFNRSVDTVEAFIPGNLLARAKRDGFADAYLAKLLCVPEQDIRTARTAINVTEGWHAVPVSGVENASYYYSTYNASDALPYEKKRKIMILGGGPNRIGQGIEFDYCCVHCAFALKEAGIETIMVNCNPETVSTDYDTSDKLYFEPLTVEDVLSIHDKEKPEGVICQFGGQTPLNIAGALDRAGVKILGTSPDTIDMAEDRERFGAMMRKLGIPQPGWGMASGLHQALAIASQLGFPLMVRPSYVLGGRGMEIVHDEAMLREYVDAAIAVWPDRPILIDKFLEDAIEAETDAISDGVDVIVPAIMEHVELAGIHSGDSACVIPPVSIARKHIDTIREYTRRIALEMKVVGLMNIQYAIAKDTVYILEANPRASRTVPLVSKVCNLSMAKVATQLIIGEKLAGLNIRVGEIKHFGVKESVFPFNMFPDVDPVLGPEMRSTGEVLGLADSFGMAYFKAQEAAQQKLPADGAVLITVADGDKAKLREVAEAFTQLGFRILATKGTQTFLAENGIASEHILKMHEGRPNIGDAIKNGEIQLVINTPAGKTSEFDDSYIRKLAIKHKIPYITTMSGAHAAAKGIACYRQGQGDVRSLQEYHAGIS